MSAKYSAMGALLSQLREASDLENQSQLADLLKVAQQTVSRWEAGESRPKVGQIPAIADALGADQQLLMVAAGYATVGSTVAFDRPYPLSELSPESFERFAQLLVHLLEPGAMVSGYGATGHKQDGLDVLAVLPDGQRFTYQCKREKYFGKGKIRSAVAAHTAEADQKVILLSRVASPEAREEMAKHPGWQLWDQEDISRHIRGLSIEEQKRIVRTFFRPHAMALLGESAQSPWESFEEFFDPFEDLNLLFNHRWELVGRSAEVEDLSARLRDNGEKVTFVTGSGGSGKSRLVKHVLCGLRLAQPGVSIRFLARDGDLDRESIAELGGGRLLLVVDDAHDRADLHALFEFAAVNRERVRLLISTRPYGYERHRRQALRFSLSHSDTTSVQLKPLTKADAKLLALHVFATLGQPSQGDLAEQIARLTYDCPLATVVAAQIIASEPRHVALIGQEDTFRAAIFHRFEKVAAGHIGEPADAVPLGKLLRFISLVQPVSLEDQQMWTAFATVSGLQLHEVNKLLGLLTKAGVLFKRGRAHRVSPDVLADYLIEDECVGPGGASTGYAERVFDLVGDNAIGHLLVNLARLDWLRKEGDSGDSTLLDGVWSRLNPGTDAWDAQLDAIVEVAFYQPHRCLDFVERRLLEGGETSRLAKICKYAAYNLPHLPRAVSLLWELGKDDERARNQEPDHAIRILKELVEIEPRKPIEYNEGVIDFGLELARSPSAWQHNATPLDFLSGILATEGHQTESDARQIFMHPFFVNPDTVRPLREHVLDLMFSLLTHPDPAVAASAARTFHEALRYPMGLLGAAPEEGARAKWSLQFAAILEKMKVVVETNDIHAAVQVELENAIAWHVGYDNPPLSDLAQAVIDAFAETLEGRTDRALADGYGMHARVRRHADEDGAWTASLDQLVVDLLGHFANRTDLCQFLETRLQELARADRRDSGSSYVLVEKLLAADTAICRAVIDYVEERPVSPLIDFVAGALGYLFRADPAGFRQKVERFARSPDHGLVQSAANGMVFRDYDAANLTSGDVELTRQLLRHENDWVSLRAVRVVREIAKASPSVAKSLVMDMQLRSERMADDVAVLFTFQSEIPLSIFTDEEALVLLAKFEHLPELEGHWVQEFFSVLSVKFPRECMRFFIQRIEAAGPREGDQRFRPINYGPWMQKRMRMRETPIARELMFEFFHWWKNAADGWLTEYHARNAFEAMFAPYDEEMVAFLEQLLETAQLDDFVYIASILREADAGFVFRYPAFLGSLLEKAKQYGPKNMRMVSTELYCAAISGARSGIAGEAFPEDIELKKAAEAALETCPRFSPLRGLYEDLLKHAEGEIRRVGEDYGDNE